MSQVIKGLSSLTLSKIFSRNCRLLRRTCSSMSKEIIPQSMVTSNTDLLLNNLKNAESVYSVLKVVNSHYKIMNNKHLIQALRSLFTLQKHSKSDLTTQEILKHPDFEKLCTLLKSQAGIIESRDTIDALKVLTYVGVSSNSLIYQVLLQLIRQNVNQLPLPQIIFLDFLLKRAKRTSLVDALQIALPIVFEAHLPVKMDRNNVAHLAEYLYYASKSNVSDVTVDIIINAILMNNNEWDSKTTVSIIWSICDLKANWRYEPILSKAFKSMIVHIDDISFQDLESTLSKLILKYNTKMSFYYNEVFCDVIGNYIIDNDIGFEQAVHILRKFLKLNYTHDNLVNYVCNKCNKNPDLIINGDPLHVHIVAAAIALTDYKPKNLASFEDAIMNVKNFNKFAEYLLSFTISLCALDIYHGDVLQKCLDVEYLATFFKKRYMVNFENILLLYQIIKTFKPEFSQYLPDDTFMKKVVSEIKQIKDFPLEGYLHRIVGGERYVKNNVLTNMWHQIDHVIVLRKGGFPVAMNISDKMLLENVEVTPGSQIVTILVLNPWHYTINSKRLKGTTLLTIKTLEAKGYLVVPICLELWNSLQEFERLPYIAEMIKLKTGHGERLSDFIS